jgi:hypothetical protein
MNPVNRDIDNVMRRITVTHIDNSRGHSELYERGNNE